MKRDVHHQPLFERFAAEPMAPDSEDPVEQMAYRLKTQAGRARYALRKHTVEPVLASSNTLWGSGSSHSEGWTTSVVSGVLPPWHGISSACIA